MAFDSTTSVMQIAVSMTDANDKKTNKSFSNIDPTKMDNPEDYPTNAADLAKAYVALTNAVVSKAFNNQRNEITMS